MGEWTALSEVIAEDSREPGFGAAATVAASWSARVDPAATRNLARAALILTDGDARQSLWDQLPPCPNRQTLHSWAEEIEAHIGDLLKRCLDAGIAAHDEHDGAVKAKRQALATARRLERALAAADQKDKGAIEADLSAARDRAAQAASVVADTEAALEILGMTDAKLRFAYDCLRIFPDNYAEVYEPAEELVAAGGKMPHSGDFVSPDYPAEIHH